ncbi:unnamed protein product [Brassica oleracea var. botrytis]|uniref:(rape) hypothetical protein n=3 Tax=Brassica TaxID=3705 RepID=A0A816KCH2_BRANA|nr:unnamed protein product [Brassica napus]
MKKIREVSNLRKTIRLVCLYEKEETELGRQQAPGSCPHCGGKVQMIDVERKWMFCFVPLCFNIKRKYLCSSCDRRLVLYHQPLK